MPQGLIKPNNAILYAGEPEIQEMEVKTITTPFCPGRLVIADTAEYQCQVAPVDSVLVLGVADVPSDKKLDSTTDAKGYYTPSAGGAVTNGFVAGDQIRVLRGDIVVKLVAKSGETIAVGTRLVAAATGMVKAATAASGGSYIIGYSLEDATNEISGSCDWILVKLTI